MKYLLTAILLLVISLTCVAQNGELRGNIMEDSTGKVIRFASLMVYHNDSLIGETVSDSLGNFILKNLPPAKYDVLCEKRNFRGKVLRNLLITVDKLSFFNFRLKPLTQGSFRDSAIDTVTYQIPLLSKSVVY
jgi:hypothetical protein